MRNKKIIGLTLGLILVSAVLATVLSLVLAPQPVQADDTVQTSWTCIKKCAGSSNPQACFDRCNAKPSQTPNEPAGGN